MDNEAEGYLPDRQREINALAGIESTLAGPALDDSDSEENNESGSEKEEESAEEKPKGKVKGDADSSSEEEGTSEELSDSDSEDEEVAQQYVTLHRLQQKKTAFGGRLGWR